MKPTAQVFIASMALLWSLETRGLAQRPPALEVSAVTQAELRAWDDYVTRRQRTGDLRVRSVQVDPMLSGRIVERLEQFHEGVRIWGSEVTRDSERGVPIAIFGVLSPDLSMRTQPTLSPDTARDFLVKNIGGDSTALGAVELVIVRRDNGEHRLSFTGLVSTGTGRVVRSFVDAHTGEEILRHDEIQTQAAVGTGTGVLGDRKKVSSSRQFGTFLTSDLLRPPRLVTYDFRGDLFRAVNVVEFGASLFDSDLASDVDNEWEDPAVVDAHVYTGWTYDYYFRRFARRGLDNNDRPLLVLTNAATQLGALSTPPAFFDYVVNAFWCGTCGPAGQGVMFFGNGIPPGFFLVSTGQNVTYLAGSIDIVAHELTHGVTDSTSRLIYEGESGALNEAFSDIIGASVEFFYQPAGSGLGQADYLIGEDSFRALRGGSQSGIRSMADPQAYGDPDHYSRRFTGSEDSGGVHINSAIANHAFYLAIEGGTNRTSRIAVQGVGAGNREQIERVFYRAFVFLLPASARFSTARAATIQAARDLYGVGSGAELAVTRAWTAVGVE